MATKKKTKKEEKIEKVTIRDAIAASEFLALSAEKQMPFIITRALGRKPMLHGSYVSFSEDGDFLSLDECKEFVKELAYQFGFTE